MNYIERYWRDAKPEDAIKEPPMVARFRDYTQVEWSARFPLDGWARKGAKAAWRGGGAGWAYCQVYDAPDPGEGWRLIDRDNENSLTGDEVWIEGGKWEPIQTIQYYGRRCVIRRRIEPPKPKYVPFTWEDREQLRGRWVRLGTAEVMIHAFTNHDKFLINGIEPDVLRLYWTFLDTGEPVGKKVTQ